MEHAYAATLPPRERRLVGRLEGFGDIVFGFAVSQCALQLPIVRGHVDIGHVASLGAYFGTFAVLARLWLSFHVLMSGPFRPTRFDLFTAFAFLAFVTLMPYAMFSISHETTTVEHARTAVAEYTVLFIAVLVMAATIGLRNLRRGWHVLDREERDDTWRWFVQRICMCVTIGVALAVDLTLGPAQCTVVFPLLIFLPRAMRWLVPRAPSASKLRIPELQAH